MLTISAPRLHLPGRVSGPGAIVVNGDRIYEVLDFVPADAANHLRLDHGILGPGLIDLQVNGFAGSDLGGAGNRTWDHIRYEILATGVTAFLATFVTAPPSILLDNLRRTSEQMSRTSVPGATVLGAHLEGPYLSPLFPGAHELTSMSSATPQSVEELLGPGSLRLMTVAPEVPGVTEAIKQLVRADVRVSLGHSAASMLEARAAVDAGATLTTHLFNAMRSLHHREPGLCGLSLVDSRIAVGMIADLHHVAPELLPMVFSAAEGRVILVTDATAASQMPPGRYALGGESITVSTPGGPPRRDDGRLAGSALTLDAAVRNVVSLGVAPAEALDAATLVPAQALGLVDRGRIQPGAVADLVWWSDEFEPLRAWRGGSAAM